MNTKPIGKLKNGTRFLYGDAPDVMVVTGSGYGRPHVLFEKETDRKDTYVTSQKRNHVIVLQPKK